MESTQLAVEDIMLQEKFTFPTMKSFLGVSTDFNINGSAAVHSLGQPDSVETVSQIPRQKSVSVSSPVRDDESKQNDIFLAFTGAYSRGEPASDLLLESTKALRPRVTSNAEQTLLSEHNKENHAYYSLREHQRSGRCSPSGPSRRFFIVEGPKREFRQPTVYLQRRRTSVSEKIDPNTVSSALDGEQELLSLPPDALVKKSGWHDRPYAHYALMFGNPGLEGDALHEAVEFAKDLYVRVLLMSEDLEASLSPAAAVVGAPSAADDIFTPIFEDLERCPHPEPTGFILRFLIVSCIDLYWDPQSPIYNPLLRHDAVRLPCLISESQPELDPQSSQTPIEVKICSRAFYLVAFSGALFSRSILSLNGLKYLIRTLLVDIVCIARSEALLVLLLSTGPGLGVQNLKPFLLELHDELRLVLEDTTSYWANGVRSRLHMCGNLAGYYAS